MAIVRVKDIDLQDIQKQVLQLIERNEACAETTSLVRYTLPIKRESFENIPFSYCESLNYNLVDIFERTIRLMYNRPMVSELKNYWCLDSVIRMKGNSKYSIIIELEFKRTGKVDDKLTNNNLW